MGKSRMHVSVKEIVERNPVMIEGLGYSQGGMPGTIWLNKMKVWMGLCW
jgi:hypothetical protein